jgi:hypothetical protein
MPAVILYAHISPMTSEVLLIMPSSYTEIYRVPIAREKDFSLGSGKQSKPQ